jgi:hypothetical protein
MKKWRRYEILLPLRYNDGKPIPTPFQQLDIWLTSHSIEVL